MPTKFLYDTMYLACRYPKGGSIGKVITLLENPPDLEECRFGIWPCDKAEDALNIVTANEKGRCPHCSSSKCFFVVLGHCYTKLPQEMLEEYPELDILASLELFRCKRGGELFLAEKMPKWYIKKQKLQIGQCPWCGSIHTEALPEGAYHEPLGMPYGTMDAIEAYRASTDKNPFRCMHCSRMFAGNWYVYLND